MDTVDGADGSHRSDTFYFVVNYINYGISVEKKSDKYSGHQNIYIILILMATLKCIDTIHFRYGHSHAHPRDVHSGSSNNPGIITAS